MLTLDWIGNFGYSVLRLSTPLIFAGMAAVISKKAGMMNMALEGMMLCAALGGVVFAGMTGNVWIGLLGAVVIGVLVGAVIAFSSLSGKTDLYLTCIAVNLASTGGTVHTDSISKLCIIFPTHFFQFGYIQKLSCIC